MEPIRLPLTEVLTLLIMEIPMSTVMAKNAAKM